MDSRRARSIILSLTVCMALQNTALSILFPIFARKLGDFGDGVEALGLSAMAFSITGLLAAPYLGSLADRFGRRPLVLGSLAAYVVTFLGYLLAASAGMFIGVRAVAGVLTAGLIPATMGIIADISPEGERGRWIGILGGGSAVGFIFGPALGGQLYDRWGLAAPFIVAAGSAFAAFLVALFLVPETRSRVTRGRDAKQAQGTTSLAESSTVLAQPVSFWAALPRPRPTFAVLLFISFVFFFSWRFVEPQLPFYVYDDLNWTSSRFGLAMSGYAVMLLLGQTLLGQLSDRFGRKPILVLGLLVHSVQYFALIVTESFRLITAGITLSGLGEALVTPALNAFYLDLTPEQYRSRVMGIKESANALGGLVGPALVVVTVRFVPPYGIFMVSASSLIAGALLALIVRDRHRRGSPDNGGAGPCGDGYRLPALPGG